MRAVSDDPVPVVGGGGGRGAPPGGAPPPPGAGGRGGGGAAAPRGGGGPPRPPPPPPGPAAHRLCQVVLVQRLPFNVKSNGGAFVPCQSARKPKETVPSAATVLL